MHIYVVPLVLPLNLFYAQIQILFTLPLITTYTLLSNALILFLFLLYTDNDKQTHSLYLLSGCQVSFQNDSQMQKEKHLPWLRRIPTDIAKQHSYISVIANSISQKIIRNRKTNEGAYAKIEVKTSDFSSNVYKDQSYHIHFIIPFDLALLIQPMMSL